MTTSNFLTTEQAATFLGLSPITLTCWRSRGRKGGKCSGPAYIKQGGAVRYREADLLAWQQDNTFNGTHQYAERERQQQRAQRKAVAR
jgi:predicted DNA-binding transcriptional regulator AlpA